MLYAEMDLPEVELDDLDNVASEWLNIYRREIAAKTTQRRLTSMRCLANALGIEILREYSAPTPALPNPHPLPGGLADLEKLVDQCNNEQQAALIALTGFCGLRISEARDTNGFHFDLHAMEINVKMGKGAQDRDVPVSDRAWELLALPVATSRLDGTSMIDMSDRSARAFITLIGRRAGITRAISSHDLRATFATEAYRNSLDIRAVQKLLGHRNVTQTEAYVDVSKVSMRVAANFARSVFAAATAKS